jgi:hypothetical protein
VLTSLRQRLRLGKPAFVKSNYSEILREQAGMASTLLRAGGRSFRDDAVRPNGKRHDNVTINDEKNAVFFGDVKVENLVAMPENVRELVTA